MKKLLSLAVVALLSFSGTLQAQVKTAIVSNGNYVEGINRAGDAGFKSFEVNNGDLIEVTTTQKTNGKTNTFVISQGPNRGTQAFLYFSTDRATWQDALRAAGTFKVAGLGVLSGGRKNTLQAKDTYRLSAQQDKPNGPINLTWDVFRNNQSVATFSANTKPMSWPQ